MLASSFLGSSHERQRASKLRRQKRIPFWHVTPNIYVHCQHAPVASNFLVAGQGNINMHNSVSSCFIAKDTPQKQAEAHKNLILAKPLWKQNYKNSQLRLITALQWD